jgi:hypothetical protein
VQISSAVVTIKVTMKVTMEPGSRSVVLTLRKPRSLGQPNWWWGQRWASPRFSVIWSRVLVVLALLLQYRLDFLPPRLATSVSTPRRPRLSEARTNSNLCTRGSP